MLKCGNEESKAFLENSGNTEDFTISQAGDWIYFSARNELGGVDIWKADREGRQIEKIVECQEKNCTDLDFNCTSNQIAYVEIGRNPKIVIKDLESEEEFYYQAFGMDLNFSPDGKYLGFYNSREQRFQIIDLERKSVVTHDSEPGLTGGWSENSQNILFGQSDYWGGIPGVRVYMYSVTDGIVELVIDNQNQNLEIFEPVFYNSQEIILAAVRERNSGPSKQLWLFNINGDIVRKVTEQFSYTHSSYSRNDKYALLLFQRFPLGQSNAVPEIVIWNEAEDNFDTIATNASNPQWLPDT